MRAHALLRVGLPLAVAATCLLPSSTAWAWRLDYDLALGVEYSDNVGRRAVDPRDEVTLRPEIRFALVEAGDRVQASIVGGAVWRDYRRGVFDDELRADIGARLNWVMIEERLAWTFEDYLAEEPVDVFSTFRPDNLQRTNFFSTGPTLSLRFSPVLAGRAELRWQDTYAEVERGFNSQRTSLALRMVRSLDALTALSGNLEATSVRPDEPGVGVLDNDRVSLFGRWARQSARRSLRADLGYSRVDFDAGEDSSGLLLRAGASFDPTESSTLQAELAHEYSDAAADLVLGAPSEADLDLPVTAAGGFGVDLTPDVFLDKRVSGAYTQRGERVQFNLRGDFRRQTYRQNPALDRRSAGVGLGLDYRLSPTANFGAFASAFDQVALRTDTESREIDIGVRFRYQARSNLWLVAELAHADRTGDLPTDDVSENRAFIGLTYSRN